MRATPRPSSNLGTFLSSTSASVVFTPAIELAPVPVGAKTFKAFSRAPGYRIFKNIIRRNEVLLLLEPLALRRERYVFDGTREQ